MKYVGNSTPSYPFGIRHERPRIAHDSKENQKPNYHLQRNSVSFGPGPGSFNVHTSTMKILPRAPQCKIGTQKREVSVLQVFFWFEFT